MDATRRVLTTFRLKVPEMAHVPSSFRPFARLQMERH